MPKPLAWPALRHVGRISYGLYVYHWFVPAAFDHFRPGFTEVHGVLPKLEVAVLFTLVALVAAEASWWLVEKPILGLKDRLDRLLEGAPPAIAPAPAPAAIGDQLPAAAADSTPG